MMAVIRAQDFASRTLRKVSSEFAHMSRAQQIAARKGDIVFQKAQALDRLSDARRTRDALRMIADRNALLEKQTGITNKLAGAQRELAKLEKQREKLMTGARSGKFAGMTPAGLAVRDAREKEVFEKKIRNVVPRRKVVSPKERVSGIHEAQGRVASTLTQRFLPLADSIRLAEQRVGQLQSRVTQATRPLARLDHAISQLPATLQQAARSQLAFQSATSKSNQALRAAYHNLTRAQQAELAFNQALKAMPLQRLDAMAHTMSGIGRTMQLFGAVGTLAFGAAAKGAANFDTTVSQAATQTRDIGASFSQIGLRSKQLQNGVKGARGEIGGILDLMQSYPATAEDMSTATYDIFSSMQLQSNGVTNVGKGLKLLESANRIAVAGSVDLGEATNAMITVLNNFDPQLQNITGQFDTMFDIVRFGRMRMSDFNVMMNKIAPAAQGAGQTLEDVGGAMAFLTEVMPSQRMVATGISRLLEAFEHPDIVAGLKTIGIEAKNAKGDLIPLPKLLTKIADTGARDAAEFFRMISAAGRGGGRGQIFTAEGRRSLNQILAHMDQYLGRQKQIIDNKDEFDRAFQAQIGTQGVQWSIFTNQMRALLIVIGKEAVPVFASFGRHISAVVEWFQSLSPGTRHLIVQFAAIASIGSLLGGVFLSMFGGMLAFEAMLKKLAFGAAGASGMLGGLFLIVQRLGAIGAVLIGIKVIRGGDMKGWDFLMAMAAGAAAGSRFGPWGALIGGITVPITLKMIVALRKE
ncbi:MAG: phage tail tape measure protein, partial [Pyrinomonadaceae bacterium]|nr:phage tail tape measure protein [Pyrinomonadaceae bacterium]